MQASNDLNQIPNFSRLLHDDFTSLTTSQKSKTETIATVAEKEFMVLASKYEQNLKALTSDPKWDKLLSNKIIALLFLDGIPNVVGEKNALSIFLHQYGYGSSTLASLAWKHVITDIMNDPHLSPESKQTLRAWIENEKEFLPFEIIFDGWRNNPEIRSLVLKENFPTHTSKLQHFRTFKSQVEEKIYNSKSQIPPQELETVKNSIVECIKNLKPGESFPLLGGYLIHETRLIVKRITEDKWIVESFDTQTGFGSSEITVINDALLIDPSYWNEYLILKFSESSGKKLYEHLLKLGQVRALATQKTAQKTDSCPAHCIEAQLKQEVISAHTTSQIGLQQYKIFKALAVKSGMRLFGNGLDKEIVKLGEFTDLKRNNSLLWSRIAEDPHASTSLVDCYNQCFLSLPGTASYVLSLESALKSGLSVFQTLSSMDKLLEQKILSLSPAEYRQIKPLILNAFKGQPLPVCLNYYEHLSEIALSLLTALDAKQKESKDVLWQKLSMMVQTYLPEELTGAFKSRDVSAQSIIELAHIIYRGTGQIPEKLIGDLLSRQILHQNELIKIIEPYFTKGFMEPLARCILKNTHLTIWQRFIYTVLSDPSQTLQFLDANHSMLKEEILGIKNPKKFQEFIRLNSNLVFTALALHEDTALGKSVEVFLNHILKSLEQPH